MASQTFTWHPDVGSQQEVRPVVRLARFGDGYEQRLRDGLNSVPEKWSVRFSGNEVEISPIRQFLKNSAGVDSFNWVTPFNETLTFVCDTWNVDRSIEGGIFTLSAEFRQVFEP